MTYAAHPYEYVRVVPDIASPEEAAFRNDGQAAYAQALQWVITGKDEHSPSGRSIRWDRPGMGMGMDFRAT